MLNPTKRAHPAWAHELIILMKLNELILVADAVERISKITETDDIPAIVDALVGLAWDEEDAGQIKAYHREDLEEWILSADVEASGSAIPAIQSSALNIRTAARDADNALECWDEEKWADAVVWINNAIAQLESARAKIRAHASLPNVSHQLSPPAGGVTEIKTECSAGGD